MVLGVKKKNPVKRVGECGPALSAFLMNADGTEMSMIERHSDRIITEQERWAAISEGWLPSEGLVVMTRHSAPRPRYHSRFHSERKGKKP